MNSYLVTRHPGALEWARRQGIYAIEKKHFLDADIAAIEPGDTVAGPLPVQIIAAINARDGRYYHIEMKLTEADRTQKNMELSADEMEKRGAHLVEYRAKRVDTKDAQL